MKNRILYVQGMLWMIVLVLISSCNGEGVEVVEQDTSWQIDQEYIDGDVRQQLKLDPYTDLIYLGAGDLYKKVNAYNDTKNTTLSQGSFSFIVKITKAYKEDLKINLVKDDASLSTFPDNVEGVAVLPEKAYKIEGNVLKAGQTETTVTVNFVNPSLLVDENGYVAAFKLNMEGTHDHLSIAHTRNVVLFRTDLTVKLDIINSDNNTVSGTSFNTGLTFESNVNSGRLSGLIDGNVNGTDWYPSGSTGYLIINLAEKTPITGLMINTDNSNMYMLKSCTVSADLGNGRWTDIGVYDRSVKGTVANINFKSPLAVTRLKISNLGAFSGSGKYVSVYEVHLYK